MLWWAAENSKSRFLAHQRTISLIGMEHEWNQRCLGCKRHETDRQKIFRISIQPKMIPKCRISLSDKDASSRFYRQQADMKRIIWPSAEFAMELWWWIRILRRSCYPSSAAKFRRRIRKTVEITPAKNRRCAAINSIFQPEPNPEIKNTLKLPMCHLITIGTAQLLWLLPYW